ncbi:MAG: substrate-binding domain-containing protein [Candidatus Methylomirabilia bacterium]
MPDTFLTTKEVAEHLGIHEKQVYALVKAGKIPASRVTGKWLFPRRVLDEWIEQNAMEGLSAARTRGKRIEGVLLAAGSHDPVLDILQSHLAVHHPGVVLFSASTGSTEGLRMLNLGHTDLAWSHLVDPETGEYNIPHVKRILTAVRPVVANLLWRNLGFVTAPGNPFGIRDFSDLRRAGVRLINRQAGAGTRLLLDRRLAELGIAPTGVAGYGREAATHYEVGLAVLSGEADTGLASGSVARMLGLEFIQVVQERFDMVTTKDAYFGPGVQAILEALRDADFRRRVANLGHYDFRDAGRILYAAP